MSTTRKNISACDGDGCRIVAGVYELCPRHLRERMVEESIIDDEMFERDNCERCGGQGFVEYNDAPETWGEDCPSEKNHLVTCPTCLGTGRFEP